jgi:NitT/TauT family transport system permease protein
MSETTLGRTGRLGDALVVLFAALLAWQLVFEYVGDVALTPPWRTVEFAARFVATGNFWAHAAATLAAFAWALAISAVLGIAGGLVLGFHRFSGEVAEPILAALYTIPKVTLYPLMLLIFGLGQPAKVAFGVIHGVIPIVLFTMAAVKAMNPVHVKTARVLRLTPWQTATTVLMPAVAPEIFTGLRVGFALTLLGVLIGEMFASQRGLGFLIINGINSHNVRITTAVILIVVVLAILANSALLALDRRMHRRT